MQVNSSRILNLSADVTNGSGNESDSSSVALQLLPQGSTITLQVVSGSDDVEVWADDMSGGNASRILGHGASQSITWTKTSADTEPDDFFPASVSVTALTPTDFGQVQFEMTVVIPSEESSNNDSGEDSEREATEHASAQIASGKLKVDFVDPSQAANPSNLGDLTKDNPDRFAGGYRLFPDAKDLASATTSRNSARVRATLKDVTAGTMVYFRAFDVDDPSKDPTIDPNDGGNTSGLGGDNRGRLKADDWKQPAASNDPGAGGFQGLLKEVGAQDPHAEHEVVGVPITENGDGTFTAEIDLVTSFAPGDNFVVVASLDDDALNSLHDQNSSQVRTSGEVEGGGEVVGSPQLSVWRHVHVERDTMSNPNGDTLGDKQNGMTRMAPDAAGGTFVVYSNISVKTPNEYNGGILRDSTGHNFLIVSNEGGDNARFQVNGSVAPAQGVLTVYQDDFTASGDPVADTWAGKATAVDAGPAQGQTAVTTDATLVTDEFKDGTFLFNNTQTLRIVSNTGGKNATIVVATAGAAAPPLGGFTLLHAINNNPPKTRVDVTNDDAIYARLQISTSTATNPFSDAYIEPEYDTLKQFSTKDVTPVTNLEWNAPSLSTFANTVRGSSAPPAEADLFWTAHMLSAYQAGPDAHGLPQDLDPPDETRPIPLAVTPAPSESSIFFLETTRDFTTFKGDSYTEELARSGAHELGHQFGLAATPTRHRPGSDNLMFGGYLMYVKDADVRFASSDVAALRGRVRSPGQ